MSLIECLRWLVHQLNGIQGARRHVLLLAGGSAAAQAIGIVTLPLTTRVYGATSYGYAAAFVGLVGMVAPFAALRYDLAIVIAANDQEASVLCRLCILLTVVTAIASAILIALMIGVFAVPPYAKMGWWVLLAAFTILCQGVTGTLTAWSNRLRLYRSIVSQRILCSIAYLLLVAGFAVLGFTEWSQLALCAIVSTGLGVLILVLAIRRQGRLPAISALPHVSLWARARRHSQFPIYNLPMTAMDQITAGLPIPFLAASFGPVTAANFALATALLRVPTSWITGAVAQVFLERAARAQHDPLRLRHLLRAAIGSLFLLGIAPAVLLILFAPWLITAVFGDSYHDAGLFARIFCPSIFLSFLFSPVSMLPTVLGRQGTHLFICSGACGGRILAICLGAHYHSAILVIVTLVITESLVLFIFACWMFRLVGGAATPLPVCKRDECADVA